MTDAVDVPTLAKQMLEAAKRATPGPWYTCGPPWFQCGSGVMAGSPDPHVGYVIVDTENYLGEREEYAENGGPTKLADPDDDAAHIALASPSNITTLCEAYLAMKERAEKAEGALEPFITCMCGGIVDKHDFGDGHSPVSQADYYTGQAIARAAAAEAALKEAEEALEEIADGPGPGVEYIKGAGEFPISENAHMAQIARQALLSIRGEGG